ERWPLGFAFWTMAGTLLLTMIGYSQFQQFTTGIQYEEKLPWLPAIGVSYHLGVDGISITMLLLTQLVGLAAVLASWEVRERGRPGLRPGGAVPGSPGLPPAVRGGGAHRDRGGHQAASVPVPGMGARRLRRGYGRGGDRGGGRRHAARRVRAHTAAGGPAAGR